MRDREGNARQKNEVYEELTSELNTLRENCIQREGKQTVYGAGDLGNIGKT